MCICSDSSPSPQRLLAMFQFQNQKRLAMGDPRAQRVLAEGPGISARGFQVPTPYSGHGTVSGTAYVLGGP